MKYQDIYRVHIKLGDNYYAKGTVLEEDFDTKEKALEWIKNWYPRCRCLWSFSSKIN